jgi:hypothetical protein
MEYILRDQKLIDIPVRNPSKVRLIHDIWKCKKVIREAPTMTIIEMGYPELDKAIAYLDKYIADNFPPDLEEKGKR